MLRWAYLWGGGGGRGEGRAYRRRNTIRNSEVSFCSIENLNASTVTFLYSEDLYE